ncbi:MAG: hypothetical protein IJ709_04250 [Selenomonas sp.]|nr:hypothetical protein [Selenomonas sp.]
MTTENASSIKELAKQKIEKEMGEIDTPLGQIGMILLAWLDYSDGAAEKINQESKTLDGAYEALRNHASKHKGKSMSYCVNPAEAMEIILEYFGQPDPKGVIEGGLMYKAMTEAAARLKPYGADSAEELPKPQPVAEKPQQEKSMSALDALNLEDFGL